MAFGTIDKVALRCALVLVFADDVLFVLLALVSMHINIAGFEGLLVPLLVACQHVLRSMVLSIYVMEGSCGLGWWHRAGLLFPSLAMPLTSALSFPVFGMAMPTAIWAWVLGSVALGGFSMLLIARQPQLDDFEKTEPKYMRVLQKLTLEVFQAGPSFQSKAASVCLICLGDVTHGDWLLRMRCQHVLHNDCVRSWFANGGQACPLRCSPVARSGMDESDDV